MAALDPSPRAASAISEADQSTTPRTTEPRRLAVPVALALLCLAGLLLRAATLSEQPYDFHSIRQLYDVLMARGIWLDLGGVPPSGTARAVAAASSPVIEPPVVQSLAALVYAVLGHESVRTVRVLLSCVWVVGAVVLARAFRRDGEATVDLAGLAVAAVWLSAPFGVLASRSFQPDGPMTVCLGWMVAALLRDDADDPEGAGGRQALLAAALAVFLKLTAIFFVVPVVLALRWRRSGRRSLLERRTWLFLGLAAAPGVVFLLAGTLTGTLAGQSGGRILPHLLTTGWFWSHWWLMTTQVGGLSVILVVVVGVLVASGALRAVLGGLCAGYVGFGCLFTYHYATHTYYHLPLLLLLALAVGSITQALQRLHRRRDLAIRRAGLLVVMALVAVDFAVSPYLPAALRGPDRSWTAEVAQARDAGRQLHHATDVIFLGPHDGLTVQTYGYLAGAQWPGLDDLQKEAIDGVSPVSVPERLASLQNQVDAHWFLVADADELAEQPDLAAYLAHLPVGARGDGWVAYRLP